MSNRSSLFIASFLCLGSLASAGPIIYDVSVNTSSISGTAGSLDFNFNPGPSSTQFASLQILDFASDGSLADCSANVQGVCPTGDVSGQLPATLTFDNGTGFNDYFDDFTFGSTISFDVSLYGPALSSPDGLSTSGSTFAFSMFSDSAGTNPSPHDRYNRWVHIHRECEPRRDDTVNNFSSQTDVGAGTSAVPGPRSLALLGTAIALLGALRIRQQWRRRPANCRP